MLQKHWSNSNVHYYKADGSAWNINEDILDLSYMTLDVAGNVAGDAKPGDYTLEFIAIDKNNTPTVSGNELIKVTIPVSIETPAFADMFEKDANWNDAKDTYTARIIANGQNATLRYINAFEKTAAYADAETSHIGIVFNALEYNQYPINNGTEYVTDNVQAVTTPISTDVELNKSVVYNDDMDALEVNKLEGMRAYYNVFDNVISSAMNPSMTIDEYNAINQAFTVVSDPFNTEIKASLDGVSIAYYIDNVKQTNVTLNSDNTITKGSGDGSNGAKYNGLIFHLGNDELWATLDNFGASAADDLDSFTLYTASSPLTSLTNNNVNVLFEGANAGESVMWNTTNKNLQFNIASDTSTLNITLKDATGIEYKLSVKVQK